MLISVRIDSIYRNTEVILLCGGFCSYIYWSFIVPFVNVFLPLGCEQLQKWNWLQSADSAATAAAAAATATTSTTTHGANNNTQPAASAPANNFQTAGSTNGSISFSGFSFCCCFVIVGPWSVIGGSWAFLVSKSVDQHIYKSHQNAEVRFFLLSFSASDLCIVSDSSRYLWKFWVLFLLCVRTLIIWKCASCKNFLRRISCLVPLSVIQYRFPLKEELFSPRSPLILSG